MTNVFQTGQKVIHDLGMTGWAFLPEEVTISYAYNDGQRYDIVDAKGREIKGVRATVLRLKEEV